jgi:UDP-N-acetylmuramoylalanine--D-glutamate ligase
VNVPTPGDIVGKAVHVIGPSGTEGSAVIDYLLRRGGSVVTAHDLAGGPEEFAQAFRRTHQWLSPEEREVALTRLLDAPITILHRERYLKGIDRANLIVLPQSWFRHPENEPLKALRSAGVPFTSMTRLFFDTCPCPIIGVTGTNGKFTVATLIYQMLREAGRPVFISGNDRTHVPMLYYLDRITPDAWLVLEISNRQLVDLERSPHIGVITNVAPHHLDDHGSMEAYARVKADLIRYQRPEDHAVLNRDNAYTLAMAGDTPGHVAWFSAEDSVERGAHVDGGALCLAPTGDRGSKVRVLAVADLPLPGRPMVENALAAIAAAGIAGVPPEAMAAVLRRFRGLPYRFRRLGRFADLDFYEDSLATNPTAAAGAIRSMAGPFFLIAGGLRRGARREDFTPMIDALAGSDRCRAVALIGSAAPVLAEALGAMAAATRPDVVMAGTLEGAMAEIRRRAQPGDAVLLSPGCESFDQFADYRQRGDRFASLAEEFAAAGAKLPATE